ncbi:MAG: ATP-dependent dethiobiotin synthetase BioD, partial [Acidimicrobiales bacterium]
MTRPASLVVVVGTATDIGKTWVTAELVSALRQQGATAVARKPVQSYDEAASAPTDADVLAAAGDEQPHDVCPPDWWYGVAMAPPMAADALGAQPPLLDDLLADIAWPEPAPALGFVEGVGGVCSPVADDANNCDLARALRPDRAILVGHAGLGTIDSVRLSAG